MSAPSGPSAIVVDASLAMQWLVVETFTVHARGRLASWTAAGIQLLAPSLILSELTNALYKRVRKSELSVADADSALERFERISVDLVVESALTRRALALAAAFGLKAAYDAQYLALAEREGCELWTADERLWNSTSSSLPWVRWIGA